MTKKTKKERHKAKRKAKRKKLSASHQIPQARARAETREGTVHQGILYLFGDMLVDDLGPLPQDLYQTFQKVYQETSYLPFRLLTELNDFLFRGKDWKRLPHEIESFRDDFLGDGQGYAFGVLCSLSLQNLPTEEREFKDLEFKELQLPFIFAELTGATLLGDRRKKLISKLFTMLRKVDFGSDCQKHFLLFLRNLLKITDPTGLESGSKKRFLIDKCLGDFEWFFREHHLCLEESKEYAFCLRVAKEHLTHLFKDGDSPLALFETFPLTARYLFNINPFDCRSEKDFSEVNKDKSLASISLSRDSLSLLEFFKENLDQQALSYEEGLKFKLLELRIATNPTSFVSEPSRSEHIAKSTLQVVHWLTHGVPRESLSLAQELLPIVVDYYFQSFKWQSEIEGQHRVIRTLAPLVESDYRLSLMRFCLFSSKREWLNKLRLEAKGSKGRVTFTHISWPPLRWALERMSQSSSRSFERKNFADIFYLSLDKEQRREIVVSAVRDLLRREDAFGLFDDSFERGKEAAESSAEAVIWQSFWESCVSKDSYLQKLIKQSGAVESEILFFFAAEDYRTFSDNAETNGAQDQLNRWLEERKGERGEFFCLKRQEIEKQQQEAVSSKKKQLTSSRTLERAVGDY